MKRYLTISSLIVAMCFTVPITSTFAGQYPMTRHVNKQWHWRWWPPGFLHRQVYQYKMVGHPQSEMWFGVYTHDYTYIVKQRGPYDEAGSPYEGWQTTLPGSPGWIWWEASAHQYAIPPWHYGFFLAYGAWWEMEYPPYDTTQVWALSSTGIPGGEFQGKDDPSTEVFEDGGGYAKRFPSTYSVDYDFSTFSLAVGDESTNWITYDLGFELPITHMSLLSADIHPYFNPKEIEIAVANTPGSNEIDTVIGNYTFPALRNGEGYEISLFPEGDEKYVFIRYIRIRILSRWRGENKPTSGSPRGARFAEVSFYGFPGTEDDDEKGKYTSSAQHDKDDSFTERSQIELHFDPVPTSTSTATIYYMIPRSDRIALSLYDVTGRLIQTLLNGEKEAGIHSMSLNVGNLSDGIYFLRLKSGGEETVKKLILLK